MVGELRKLETEGLLKLDDSVIVTRDEAGNAKYSTDHHVAGAGTGAALGGLWGLLVSARFQRRVGSPPALADRARRPRIGRARMARELEMSKLRLLVVDDHEVVRAGLRTLLGMEDDLEVVGEAGSGEAALAQA